MRLLKATAASTLFLVCSTAALAHSRLLTPSARSSPDPSTQDIIESGGLNFDAPCGENSNIPSGPPVVTWAAGSDQTVIIDHRVLHGDERYRFFVSFDGGQSFDEVDSPTTTDGSARLYQPGGINADSNGNVSVRFRLPDTGGIAVLRYTDGEYFSCADVFLQADVPLFADGFESGSTSAWEENVR